PKDGNIYVGNLRGAQATDVYTCRGDGTGEDYTPTFTQHGFRYAEVTGLGAPLMPDQIRAVEMHTALSQHSAVEFGTPLLNKIQHAVLWGQKSNVMSVPTDCPQRDERRGWTGDAALTAEEALYNYGMGAVYSHWLDVFADDQAPNGGSNDFVPALGGGEGAPNWQSAFPTLIWGLLTYYGDGTMATKHFDALGKYYDNLEAEYNSTGAKKF
ncbi:MAG: family 78 glycoside hydrolase catalytic domain, partial [Akkermansiaceae bacterium]